MVSKVPNSTYSAVGALVHATAAQPDLGDVRAQHRQIIEEHEALSRCA